MCGYGVAQQGNTGCGIETEPIATRSKAKDAHLDWQGMKVDTKVDVDTIGVSTVRSSLRAARARRSWIYFSWETKKPSEVEETPIPRK